MRAQSLLLLVAFLALGSQLPTASGRKKGDKETEAQWETTCPRPQTDSESVLKVAVEGKCLESGGLTSQTYYSLQNEVSCFSLRKKSGGCPPDDGPCLLSVPDQCVDDSQCPSRMKCCHKSCFRQCVRRVTVKLGACPEDRLHCLSPIQHLCHKDSDCRGSSRCCLGACGRDCRSPVRG